jgi:hypothetical protein
MTEVTVLEAGCDDLAGSIASRIEECGGHIGDVLIRSIHSLKEAAKTKPDILVLPAEAVSSGYERDARVSCSFLLLPGDSVTGDSVTGDSVTGDLSNGSADATDFDAGCIVTYGMSPKNTITLSSISEDTCVLALQRELVTIHGDILDRQEMMIKGGLRPDCLLAVVGTLLILGLKISDTNQ